MFSWIDFWPSSGREDQPWTDDPATDALVKSACRVSGAYAEALGDERLEGPWGSLQFSSHLHDDDRVELQVDTDDDRTGWTSGAVFVPEAVAELSAHDRALLVLDLIHHAVVELAPHRGWSLEAIERVRDRVLAQDLEFSWASPWKSSPDRSMAARVVFRVDDDGRGRAQVEVRDRRTDELIARSAPALAYNALVNFRASAKTLRWARRSVQFVPRTGSPHGEVVIGLDPDLGEIHPESSADRGHAGEAAVETPAIVLAPYGSHVEDKTPGIELSMGFGVELSAWLVPDVDGTYFSELIELELFDRIGSGEAGIDKWLDGLPVELSVEYHLPAHLEWFGEYGVRLRRTKKCLSVVLLRDGTWMAGDGVPEAAVRLEISAAADQVVAALSARVARETNR
ncbi:hypothetical protein ASE01_23120 [Nocardioides sp. Root190]|nr:hypothetical protein ASE01_23120 [Nocardioides sp. Root190]